jgi:hypothetical protein
MNRELALIKRQNLHLPRFRNAIDDAQEEYPFAWFVTLDFRREPSEGQDAINMAMGWLIHLARKYNAHFFPFIVSEPEYTGKRMSVHMILRSNCFIPIKYLREAWYSKYGTSVIRKYRPELGGSEYNYKGHLAHYSTPVCAGKKPCRINRQGNICCSFTSKSERVRER